MEMEDQYGLADLRQLMTAATRTHFPPSIPQHHDLFSSGYRNLPHHHNPYDLIMMVPRDIPDFRSDSAAGTSSASAAAAAAVAAAASSTPATVSLSAPTAGCGFEVETGCLAGESGTGRWPRQETLTLLEIRSRLDSKFKEANQKGPLWDEVSRIMAEEHNYQRSGKKCREKFENLYKYYKKTKEGKAGRQDGKNYRFFRQLEALYGETSNATSLPDSHFVGDSNLRFQNGSNNPTAAPLSQEAHHSQQKHYCDSLSLSNTSEFDTSASSDDGNDDLGSVGAMDNDSVEKRRKRRGGKCWKAKIKHFIDSQMRKLIDKQEAWLEKLMKTLEQKEKERMVREEEWRRQEVSRIDRERSFWAKERAWIEARDAALMEALQKLTGRELREYNSSPDHGLMAAEHQNHGENQNEDGSEILNNSNARGDHHLHHHHHHHHHQDHEAWLESEITKLIQMRTAMKSRFRQSGSSFSDQEILWEEIASKMACLGYDRTALMYKEKWESIENYQRKIDQGNKKRKENSRATAYSLYFQTDSSLYSGGAYSGEMKEQSPNSSNAGGGGGGGGGGHAVQDNCFRFLMGEGDQSQSGLWENFGLKLNNGGDQT